VPVIVVPEDGGAAKPADKEDGKQAYSSVPLMLELKIITTEQRARELGEYLIMAANSSGRTGACVNLILDIGPSALRVRVYIGDQLKWESEAEFCIPT
jgi:hypothetical protein